MKKLGNYVQPIGFHAKNLPWLSNVCIMNFYLSVNQFILPRKITWVSLVTIIRKKSGFKQSFLLSPFHNTKRFVP